MVSVVSLLTTLGVRAAPINGTWEPLSENYIGMGSLTITDAFIKFAHCKRPLTFRILSDSDRHDDLWDGSIGGRVDDYHETTLAIAVTSSCRYWGGESVFRFVTRPGTHPCYVYATLLMYPDEDALSRGSAYHIGSYGQSHCTANGL
jgi:hypothetical protein